MDKFFIKIKMKEKKVYETPVMEVIEFVAEGCFAASGLNGGAENGENRNWGM